MRKKAKKSQKVKKSERNKKIDLNFASIFFPSKQKSLNRSEAKNLMQKIVKNSEKKRKKAKK
jgi:hypothetical protein